jgi:putative tryptophan/tyrosine transport system substrate-binding protein
MRRREFITLLGGAAAWPLAARGQQASKVPMVGFLGPSTPSAASPWAIAFEQRLRELGWNEGRNIALVFRWAEGRSERYAEISSEFIRLNVDVIVTVGGAALVAKQMTSSIPIVFAVAADPLGSGLVSSLARPGGNATGLSVQFTDTTGKRLELLRELVPGLRMLAVMANAGYPAAMLEVKDVQAVAQRIGLDLVILEIQRAGDIAPAFESLNGRAGALYVVSDSLVDTNGIRINSLALAMRLPTIYSYREQVERGGLMSYGANFPDMFRRAGDYVDKILRGAKPAELPVEQPTKFDLVINLTSAKALGLTVPDTLLARADEVIE